MIRIREEQSEDIPVIREVNKRAFGQPQEADIVDELGIRPSIDKKRKERTVCIQH